MALSATPEANLASTGGGSCGSGASKAFGIFGASYSGDDASLTDGRAVATGASGESDTELAAIS